MSTSERKTHHSDKFDADTVGVTVHTTKQLHDRNGRESEKTVVQYISQALEDAGLNYAIDFNFPLKEPEIDDLEGDKLPGKQHHQDWWREFVNEDSSFEPRKDSNILLDDRDGGGLAAVTGWVAVAPGRNISDYRRHEWTGLGSDSQAQNIFATLHEFSHNLGFSHSPHFGYGWNENGRWHRTITVSGNGEMNKCDEWVENRRFEKQKLYFFYNDCAFDHFDIKDKELVPFASEGEGLPDPPHQTPDIPEPERERPEEPPDENAEGGQDGSSNQKQKRTGSQPEVGDIAEGIKLLHSLVDEFES